jgi:putative ABC transport system permease protein
LGIDPNLLPYLGIEVQRGQLSLQPGEMLVGARVGENFYDPREEEWTPVQVDLFESQVKLNLFQFSPDGLFSERKVNVTISGEIREGSNYDYAVFMPIQDVMKYNEWATGQKPDPETFRYDQVTVRATSRETVNTVIEAIREMGYNAGGLGEYVNQLNSFFGTMRLVLGGVGGVALIVAAFGVANTMMMAIIERTREIGLMKAIGATDRDVLTVFLIEAGLVGLSGGVAGVALSYVLQNLVNQAIQNLPSGEGGISFLPIDPSMIGGSLIVIPPELAVFAVVLAVLVGVGAGLYPALRAAQLPPVIALKME